MKKAMPFLAFAAPVAIFGLLHTLLVQPQRMAADAARMRVPFAEATPGPPLTLPSTHEAFDGRLADLVASLASSPAVGGVTNLSIETAAPGAPVTVTFEAQYAQIGRFFWNLPTLPARVAVQSVELTPAVAPKVRAKIVLSVLGRRTTTPGSSTMLAPEWPRDPFAAPASPVRVVHSTPVLPPAPVVKSILFSASRRVALVDGRIVGVGDRVGTFLVEEIEPDSVLLVTPQGVRTRIELQRK
jgi:hypothetical protein